MGDKTAISWTDSTWNPIRGCSKVSDGCRNCYAEGVANRFNGPGLAYEGLVHVGKNDGRALGWNGNIKFVEEHLLDPLRWKRPRRIFVNSMSDLFHENVTDEMRDRIFAVMEFTRQHTFQVLTKRPENMLRYMSEPETPKRVWRRVVELFALLDDDIPEAYVGLWPPINVWLGVSVENQQAADERIPLLLQTPAAVRFLSCEPLLGPIDLWKFLYVGAEGGIDFSYTLRQLLHWVIAGGESGHKARPMRLDWARSLRDQCVAADVPFHFKQWGEWAPADRTPERHARITMPGQCRDLWAWVDGKSRDSWKIGPISERVGTKAAGHLLDGVEHHAFPEVA